MSVETQLFALLGAGLHERRTIALLEELGISPKIKRRKGETTEIVENKQLGVEISFRDERAIQQSVTKHREGELVLVNIRMYVEKVDGFEAYKGRLPFDLPANADNNTISARLGPATVSTAHGLHRWDFELGSIAISISGRTGGIKYVSVLMWPRSCTGPEPTTGS